MSNVLFPHTNCNKSVAEQWLRIVYTICPTIWYSNDTGMPLVKCYHGFSFPYTLLGSSRSINITELSNYHKQFMELKYANKNS